MPTSLVSMPDVYAHLNLNKADTSYQAELQGFIDAATGIFTYHCGPIAATSFTENWTITPGQSQINLLQCPVLSIQSVIEYVGLTAYTLTEQPRGSTVNNYGFSLDMPSGGTLVRRSSSGMPCAFIGDEVVVTYTAGRATIPPEVRLAALEDIRGLWQQTQQGSNVRFNSSDSDTWMMRHVAVKFFPRIQSIIDGQMRQGAIA